MKHRSLYFLYFPNFDFKKMYIILHSQKSNCHFFRGKTKLNQQFIFNKTIYFSVKSLLKNLVGAIIYKSNDNDNCTLEKYFLLYVELH